MKKPHELRAEARQKLDQAKAIYDAHLAAGTDPSAEEGARYDALLAEAEGLTNQAGEAEARERRFADLDKLMGQPQQRHADPLPHEDPANTRNGRHGYSLMKAMREKLLHRLGEGPGLTGVESETHQELVKRRFAEGIKEGPRGILIPWSLPVNTQASRRWAQRSGMVPEARALDTSAGTGSIPTILDATLIDLLRARMVTRQMGARVMEGMQGLFAIPRQSGAGAFYMLGEGGAPTGSAQSIDQVAFTPHTGGAYTDYTRRFLEQTNQDAEQFVRDDLTAIVARGVENQAFNGTNASNQTKGLLNNASVTSVAIGTNGGAPTWDTIVGLESTIAIANADMGSLGYIVDAAGRGKLKRTAKIGSTFPIYLWDTQMPEAPVNGYPVGVTNLLPGNLTKGTGTNLHAMLYGNWSDLIFAFWSGIDILVDPYSGSTSGNIRIVALQDFDQQVRHAESFAKVVDMDVS